MFVLNVECGPGMVHYVDMDAPLEPRAGTQVVARVGAVLRRVRPALAGETLTFADVEMDTVGHKVRRGGGMEDSAILVDL